MSESRNAKVQAPTLPVQFVHLCTLWGFAGAQPVFEVLGKGATYFVARDAPPSEIVAFAAGLILLPPLLLTLIAQVARRGGERLGWAVHLALVGGLVTLFLMPTANAWMPAAVVPVVGLALAGGGVFAWAYARTESCRTFLTVLSPAVLVFAGFFLLGSHIRPLLVAELPIAAKVAGIESRTPIVFVLLDEISTSSLMTADGTVDRRLFPSFARLADRSVWFRNTTATVPMTDFVVPVIMTGRHRKAIKLPLAQNYPNSLFTLFAKSHRIVAVEPVTALCPDDVCEDLEPERSLADRGASLVADVGFIYAHLVLPKPLAGRLPPIDHRWGSFWKVPTRETAEQVEEMHAVRVGYVRHARNLDRGRSRTPFAAFERFIDAVEPSPDPTLYYLHVLLPHVPWSSFPSGMRYEAGDRPDGTEGKWKTWLSDEWPTQLAFQRYMLQLGYTDVLLGRLLDRLDEADLFDRSLMIVLGDHGITFQPGQMYRQPTDQSVRDLMHVPFFVKLPFQKDGRVDDRNVESIDVLPTVASALEVELPFAVDGVSGLDSERPDKKMYAGGEEWSFPGERPSSWPALDRKLALFGDEGSWRDIERAGPRPELVGRPLASLDVAGELWAGATARVEGTDRFEHVELITGSIPAYVRGTVRGERLPDQVAVAVHGTVWAVVEVFDRRGDEARVWLLLPEEAFRNGSNDLELYAVEGERLTRLTTARAMK